MPFLSRVFGRNKEAAKEPKSKQPIGNKKAVAEPLRQPQIPQKLSDPWLRRDVDADEVDELLHFCYQQVKSRGLDMPFLLLPFRPNADTSSARPFIRNFFKATETDASQYQGIALHHELRLLEPVVICSIMKWCWSRLKGGVVTWNTYNLFQSGEKESNMAKHAFDTFIPLSVESDARKRIIFDFFDLLAAVSANGKTNGLGGRKLSRLAGWWVFEHVDSGKGFDGGYKSWESAANASSHLYFAYLRSLAPDDVAGSSGISQIPRSLQALLAQTEYPPETPSLLKTSAPKVIMIVENVSPTPYALLRRGKNFEYRDEDSTLQRFSEYEDPVQALTFECRRVLDSISSINQSSEGTTDVGGPSTIKDPSWSRFEDIGFSSLLDGPREGAHSQAGARGYGSADGLRTTPSSVKNDFGRPTTPSWADFLSSGFQDNANQRGPGPLLLPPQQILPPISNPPRVHSSQSHYRNGQNEDHLEPGELASIARLDVDETFWWVWMASLAEEEPPARKAAFGRCAFVETEIYDSRWLVMEEQVKGAAAPPDEGAYIAEKKSRFTFTRRGRARRSSMGKKAPAAKKEQAKAASTPALSKPTVNPEQHAKVQAAAAELVRQQHEGDPMSQTGVRRGRTGADPDSRTNSVMTLGLQPTLQKEAGPAMQWARKFDKDTIRARYLGNPEAGTGTGVSRPVSMATTMDLISAIKAVDNEPKPEDRDQSGDPSSSRTGIAQDSHDDSTSKAQSSTLTPSQTNGSASIPRIEEPAEEAKQHRYKESEKTVVSPDAMYHTSRKPVGSVDKTPRTPTDHPAFRQGEDQGTYNEEQQEKQPTSDRPKPDPAAAAAAAALKSSSQQQQNQPQPAPNVQKSKTGSTRKMKNLFRKKREEKGDEPEALAMHRKINTQSLRKPKDKSAGLVAEQAATPPPPSAAPPPVPNEAEHSGMVDDQPSGPYDMEGGEPGPEVETGVPYESGHSHHNRLSETTDNTDQHSAHFSNFTQGPLHDQPAFAPMDNPSVPSFQRQRGESSVSMQSEAGAGEFQTQTAARLFGQQDRGPPNENYGASDESAHDPHQKMDSYHNRDLADDETSESGAAMHPVETNQSEVSQDRWAQIRKNAAERRNEGQASDDRHTSQPSQSAQTEKTDDGETSGEETIESRVARIRARVAQLTSSANENPSTVAGEQEQT